MACSSEVAVMKIVSFTAYHYYTSEYIMVDDYDRLIGIFSFYFVHAYLMRAAGVQSYRVMMIRRRGGRG